MRQRPERKRSDNIGVLHGEWGEAVAVQHLRRHGYEIVERNSRPVEKDERLEIDLVAWDRKNDAMVFVEVKQHAKPSPYSRRLRSVDKRKRENLRRACNAWRRVNRWHGAFRFDVIEIYGVPEGGNPVIDHIEKVDLFAKRDRFVKWS